MDTGLRDPFRQVGEPDLGARAEDCGTLDRVAEFPKVPGPRVMDEGLTGLGSKESLMPEND
jgi:hypothetical protein